MLEARSLVKAPMVDDVSFTVEPGETLALVGGSGAGKSTVARLLTGLVKPDSGQVLLHGSELTGRGPDRARRKDLQMVFQDQSGSLDPMRRVGDIIAEPLVLHTEMTRVQRLDRVMELLDQVGLQPGHARRRPRELSGGQRQRVAIARAVACRPGFVVLDEPVSSVDTVARRRVLSLLATLRTGTGFGCLLISHDLGVVRQVADRVAVMRAGRLVETAPVAEIFTRPQHEYTRDLIAARPSLQARRLG
jgi:ABC-type glutathione transport system ATPase component